MAAIRFPNKHRPRRHRLFRTGEYVALMTELVKFPAAAHWRRFARLAIETGAGPRDLADATWDQFTHGFKVWNVPATGSKGRAKPVTITRSGRRTLRALRLAAAPDSPRVFHALSDSPLSLSIQFGAAARRAGLDDFCLKDLQTIALAKRIAAAPSVDPRQIGWALGMTQGDWPRALRSYRAR
jgi:integrase